MKLKLPSKVRRRRRVRAKIFGTKLRPRLSVFRSAKHIYAQLIDDEKGVTLSAAHDTEIKGSKKINKVEVAKKVGKLIAEKAVKLKITSVVFDRGPYKYQGRVKAVAEGAREGGLKF